MHEINERFKEVTDELWSIKRYTSKIDFKDLISFYREYQSHENLVIDTINAQVIQYDGLDMPFSDEDISCMIDAFVEFNKYNYSRLIIEVLFVLNNAQCYQYLSKILDTEEKKMEFEREFHRWPHFEQVKDELKKIGNEL